MKILPITAYSLRFNAVSLKVSANRRHLRTVSEYSHHFSHNNLSQCLLWLLQHSFHHHVLLTWGNSNQVQRSSSFLGHNFTRVHIFFMNLFTKLGDIASEQKAIFRFTAARKIGRALRKTFGSLEKLAMHATNHPLKMDFKDQFVALNVRKISATVFRQTLACSGTHFVLVSHPPSGSSSYFLDRVLIYVERLRCLFN